MELEIDEARADLEDTHNFVRVFLFNHRLRINLHDELLEWVIKILTFFIEKLLNSLL